MTKVSVIIVTYNAVPYLDGLFRTLMPALARSREAGIDAEVLVVENLSKDDTLARLRAVQGITVIESGSNLGFAGGNNLGIHRAMDAGADYVYLLNQDTEVEPDFLIEAVAAMEDGERVGAVQSLLLLHPDTHLVNSTGNAIHFLGLGYSLGYRRPASEVPRNVRPEIAYPSGAGVLFCTDALRKVGLLDDTYFMYHEDLDLGWRLRLAGYRILMAPTSVVYHKYAFSKSIAKFYWMERNRWITLWKDLRMWSLVVLALPLLIAEVALVLAAIRGGWWREKLRVYVYFMRPSAWTRVFAERRKVQSTRVVSDREIVRLWTPVISFQEVSGPFTTYVANPLMRVVWAILRVCII